MLCTPHFSRRQRIALFNNVIRFPSLIQLHG